MTLRPWKKLSEKVMFKNPWWTYKRDEVELPTGKKGEYHYVSSFGSCMVIPILPDGRVLTVSQYRHLGGRDSIEFPCGSIKVAGTRDETARQELVEETGYTAGRMVMVGEFNPFNGVTDEMCYLYIARELQHVGGTPDETEEFELVPLTAYDLEEKIRDGIIWDGMTIAAWHIARTKLG